MEFEPGKKYKSKQTGSVFVFIGESAFDKSILIFESCGCPPFHETRSYANAQFEPYREPIECVRWGFYMTDGDCGTVLYYSINKQHIEKEHAKFMKCGTTCSEIIEIRGTMK